MYHNGEDISHLGFQEMPDEEPEAANCPKCNAKRLYEDDICVVCGFVPPMPDYVEEPEWDAEKEYGEAWDALVEEYND